MRSALCLALFLALRAAAETPVETLYVVPGSHLDIGFTATPDEVKAKRVRVLDDAIAAAQADPAFRWFEESAWTLFAWRDAHAGDRAALDALRALMKEGRISAGAAWCSPHAAAFPESLDLLFAHLDDFERIFGVRPAVAVLNDVPSYPEALVDAAARAGVRYLLIGANIAFSPPMPARLSRTPFWWESAAGNRVLAWVDDDSYTAAYTKWGIDPGTARFFGPKEFPGGEKDLDTMKRGIDARLASLAAPRGAAVVQHAFDNWDTGAAARLPAAAALWNGAGRGPRIVAGGPDVFFADLDRTHGREIPAVTGEWGGQWDTLRAANPVWTWRLQVAMRRAGTSASPEDRAALATAMEHSQGLGPGWPGMLTREQVLAHNAQVAALFLRASRVGLGDEAATALPVPRDMPRCAGEPVLLKAVLAHVRPRVRAGQPWFGPFVAGGREPADTEIHACTDLARWSGRVTLTRTSLPAGDTAVVIEVGLKGRRAGLTIAPVDSPAGRAGRWLTGTPPAYVVAPGGVRIEGLAYPVTVTADLILSWALVADGEDPEVTWLQGLALRQGRVCTFKGDVVETLAFADLYPGEPDRVTFDISLFVHE